MSESGRDSDAERDDDGTGTDARIESASGVDRDLDPDADTDPDLENEAESENGEPVEVGDNRQKYVEIVERSGEHTEHAQIYLRHATDEFVVSTDEDFPAAETTRYSKADLLRVEVAQQHSTCFITTATVGDGRTLDELRTFRDDVLRSTPVGNTLVGVYERISPPIARTLSRHPRARTTELVRWLVGRSGALERRRRRARFRPYRIALALALVGVYLVGVCCALCGHAAIGLRESVSGPESIAAETNGRRDTNAETNTETRP